MAWHPFLVRVSETLAGTWRFGPQYRQSYDLKPALGSKADSFIQQDGTTWPNAWDAYARANMYLFVGEDHLFSLSKLVGTEEPSIFGYIPVSRAAVEAFARAWWFFDSEIDRPELLRRGATERIYNSREELNVLRKVGHPAAEKKATGLAEMVKQCADAGIEVKEPGRLPNQFSINGEKRPASSTLIAEMMNEAGYGDIANMIYNYLSGGAKALPFTVIRQFEAMPDKRSASPKVSLDDIRTPVMTALYAWKAAMSRLVNLYSWDKKQWKQWTERIDKVLVQFPVI